jgi:hypothetical protein
MPYLRSTNLIHLGRATVAWALLFAVIHVYWAAGGGAGMNGDSADTASAQGYIAFIAALGVAGAAVARGVIRAPRRTLVMLARAGGVVLFAGVVVGVGRWIADGGLNGDGAAGVVITAYFLLGGVLFSALGWRVQAASS